MQGVSKIIHNNQEILYIDYRGCTLEEEMIAVLREAQRIVIEDSKPYLQLINMVGVFATPGFMSEAKKVAHETPKIATRRAIVGIDSPGRKVLLQIYNLILGSNKVRPFDTLDQAKDWLTSDKSDPQSKIRNYNSENPHHQNHQKA